MLQRPELLAPAGDMERLRFARLYGADAVYLAGDRFGMRGAPKNFSLDELEALALKVMDLEGELNEPDVLRDHVRLREVCDALDEARFRQDEALGEWEQAMEEQEAEEQEDAPRA